MGQIQSLSEFIGLLIRRRLLIGAITVFGIVITLLYVVSMSPMYESAAVIQVQSPRVAETDATTPQASASAQRLQAIEQRLTTRENLLAVMERHDLYVGLPLTDDEKIQMLRESVRFQTVASAASPTFGAPPAVSALIIFAQADTRDKAARIANDFAQSILDAGAEGQVGRAREALTFFRDEEVRLRAEIQSVEAQLAEFKNANRDALPEARSLRQEEIIALEADLRALEQSIVGAQSERDAVARKPNLRSTDRRQMDDLSTQIETLDNQRAALQNRRDTLQQALARAPDIERDLSGYERNLEQLQSQFEVVTRRVAEADTAQKLEERQQGESFALLERAVEPDYPITGGRKKLAMVGAIASLLQAIGIAFVLDQLHPVLRTKRQVERQLDLIPIVTIPDLPQLQRRNIRPSLWSRLIDYLDNLPDLPVGISGLAESPKSQTHALPRHQAIAGGAAVILLVVVAAAMT